MSIVNPNQTTTFNLTAAENPVTFGASTHLDVTTAYAVTGAAGVYWNVTNQGYILGGVSLDGKSTVTNSGTIKSVNSNALSAIDLRAGGAVTNQSGGVIAGYAGGVLISGGVGTVTNIGSITSSVAHGSAIALNDGGDVTNAGTLSASGWGIHISGGSSGVVHNYGGTISGYDAGVYINAPGGSADVFNNGTIASSGGYGVALYNGGGLKNLGTISGYAAGVRFKAGAGTVANYGTITAGGPGSTAVMLDVGGVVLNKAKGVISSTGFGVTGGAVAVTNYSGGAIDSVYNAIYLQGGGGTVTNAGSITASNGVAVLLRGGGKVTNSGAIKGSKGSVMFAGVGAGTLTLLTGSALTGAAVGSTATGATNALVLQGAGTAANSFLHFNTLSVKASGVWTLSGASAIGVTSLSTGTLAIGGAFATSLTESASAALTIGAGKVLTLIKTSTLNGSVGGAGAVHLASGAKVTLAGAVGASDVFAYTGAVNEDLVLNDLHVGGLQLFEAKIAGFVAGDQLDAGAPFGAGTTFVFTENLAHTYGVLALTDGTIHAALTLLGNHLATSFHTASDGHGGTLLTYA